MYVSTVTEPELVRKSPSLIASGCVLAAARGLRVPGATAASVCGLTRCRIEDAEAAASYVDAMTTQQQSPAPERPLPAPAAPKHDPAPPPLDHGQPETPTDVQDIFFWKHDQEGVDGPNPTLPDWPLFTVFVYNSPLNYYNYSENIYFYINNFQQHF